LHVEHIDSSMAASIVSSSRSMSSIFSRMDPT
jgi:hypothetical protein